MQAGFEYNYKDSNEIIVILQKIADFSTTEFILLGSLIMFVCIGIYFLFPILFIIIKYLGRLKEKSKRKLMLKQIALQRDIEDEIEAEIEASAQAQDRQNKDS